MRHNAARCPSCRLRRAAELEALLAEAGLVPDGGRPVEGWDAWVPLTIARLRLALDLL